MPFTKGDPNINRKGQPKRDWTWSGVLAKAVEAKAKDGKPIKEHIANSLIVESLKGNVVAQKEIMNRMDGMPSLDINQTGSVTMTVNIVRHKVEELQDGSSV